MSRRGTTAIRTVATASAGFIAGMIAMAVAVWGFPDRTRPAAAGETHAADHPPAEARSDRTIEGEGRLTVVESRASRLDSPPPIAPPLPPLPTATPVVDANPTFELRDRHLQLPVSGVLGPQLRDSFDETRGSARRHEAIDIMAPRNTPILAVEDGTIARLFDSKPGGTTVYQFDPAAKFAYYYAHLERYADGLHEGQAVKRGQLLGYVGTTGNAPKNAPHLHFAIFRLTEKKEWWRGAPIDPYGVFR